MTNPTRKRRVRFYLAQRGYCYCCGRIMWEEQLSPWQEFMERTLPPEFAVEYQAAGRSRRRKMREPWRCTYEHFAPQKFGRRLDAERDCATCKDCNNRRGHRPYLAFRALVRSLGSAKAAASQLSEAA